MGNHSKCFRCGELDEYCACVLPTPTAMNAASPTDEAQALADTDQVPYLIVFEDADQESEPVIGGTRARYRFKQISGSWNAHLFVKIASNCLDEKYPSASLAAPVAQGSATSGEAAFEKAVDAVYPIPDTPHTSVLQRAADNRIAFRWGYEAALAAKAEQPNTIEKLLEIIACAYQIAGTHGAPEHILDVLADPESASIEEVEAMLPYVLTERAAAPASVPREWISEIVGPEVDDLSYGQGYRRGWNDCRAKVLAAPEVAQPAAQGENIDQEKLLELILDWESSAPGSVATKAFDVIVEFIHAWAAKREP